MVMTADVKEENVKSGAIDGIITVFCDQAAKYLREMSRSFFGESNSVVKNMAEKTTESAITILSKKLHSLFNGSVGGTEVAAKYLASAFDMVTANNSELLKSFFTAKNPDNAGL